MIHSFYCKNFYSFKNKAEVVFVVNKQAPESHGYFIAPSGTRLTHVGVVIGPNASGKTNLLKVIPFFRWLFVSSFHQSPDHLIPVKPFQFSGLSNQPSELGVCFEIDSQIYHYQVSLDSRQIILEKLAVNSKSSIRKTSKLLFSRSLDKKTGKYTLKHTNLFSSPAGLENALRTNAPIIATAMHFNHAISRQIFEYWRHVETNVVESGYRDDSLRNTLIHYSEYPILKDRMERILTKYDVGFSSIDIVVNKNDREFTVEAEVAHSVGNKTGKLDIRYESSGTKRLIILLKNILISLESGTPAIIDEIDINLHPDMIIELVSLYLRQETNPHHAQLFTSTHSHLVLSRLDKYQIYLTEKDSQASTEVWRLDDMEGVRPDDNYYNKYVSGSYGATPDIG